MPVPDVPRTPRFSDAIEQLLRDRAAGLPTRRRRARAAAASAVAVLTVAAVLLAWPGGGTEQARATGFSFPSGRTMTLDPLSEPRDFREVADAFTAAGAELLIRPKPVRPQADGRIFSVEYPENAKLDAHGRLVVDDQLEGPVTLVVGRGDAGAPAGAGLTIYEAIPELCALVDADDAPKTARALRAAGFHLEVTDVEFLETGTVTRAVADPPPDSLVISVLDRDGRYTSVDPSTRRLKLEVGSGGDGHHGDQDGACTR